MDSALDEGRSGQNSCELSRDIQTAVAQARFCGIYTFQQSVHFLVGSGAAHFILQVSDWLKG